jgi:tRNA threonylcarbamoyladenosine biosynthesis protein TsaE
MLFNTPIITENAEATEIVGREFADYLLSVWNTENKINLVCLSGELGSGKTTFVHGLARTLGIKSRIISPTFIIVRSHPGSPPINKLHHIDLYRLDPSATSSLGLNELWEDTESITVVEWPENLGSNWPKNRIDIKFKVLSDMKHELYAERK